MVMIQMLDEMIRRYLYIFEAVLDYHFEQHGSAMS